jgi:hypothetical protein
VKPLLLLSALLVVATACHGPAASDAALCTDLSTRLCATPVCPVVTERLKPGKDCLADLSARAGCDAESFTWGDNGTPSRDRILDCRLPLIRSGDDVSRAPRCEEVEETFDRCPDIATLFDGGTP